MARWGAQSLSSRAVGLSIVDAVTTAHGGRLQIHARPEGGLTVRITFPER